VYKNFVEKSGGLDVGFQADGLTGGTLLGVTGQGGVSFFDWQTGGLVRRIEVEPKNVYWSESGELVAIACEDTFYVLRFSRDAYVAAVQAGELEEDGVESAFEVITDISERYVSDVAEQAPGKLTHSASERASGSAPFLSTPTARTG
jgi:coatomer subunit beta'